MFSALPTRPALSTRSDTFGGEMILDDSQAHFAWTRASQMVQVIKEPACQCRRLRDEGSTPGTERSPGGGHGSPTPVFVLGESHGQRSLAGYSPWGHKRVRHSWATKYTSTHFDLELPFCYFLFFPAVFFCYSVSLFLPSFGLFEYFIEFNLFIMIFIISFRVIF